MKRLVELLKKDLPRPIMENIGWLRMANIPGLVLSTDIFQSKSPSRCSISRYLALPFLFGCIKSPKSVGSLKAER